VVDAERMRLGIMGGMFDPVHLGHMQLAQQVQRVYELDEILLVPCGSPVHRPRAHATDEARIAMVELACRDVEKMRVDARECLSKSPSYTYNTLSAIQAEQPASVLYLLLGLDAFLALPTWFRWQEIFLLAHIVVVSRPGFEMSNATLGPVLWREYMQRRAVNQDDFKQTDSGRIVMLDVPTLAISSTEIRNMVRSRQDTSPYLNKHVATYIRAHKLYQ
jgi:nicotinate-nucleotide adenylyltransferase